MIFLSEDTDNIGTFCLALCDVASAGTRNEASQELRRLSRSLSDCKSLTLNVMIQVSQFVSNPQLCHYKPLIH